jgi:hypothetical protein
VNMNGSSNVSVNGNTLLTPKFEIMSLISAPFNIQQDTFSSQETLTSKQYTTSRSMFSDDSNNARLSPFTKSLTPFISLFRRDPSISTVKNNSPKDGMIDMNIHMQMQMPTPMRTSSRISSFEQHMKSSDTVMNGNVARNRYYTPSEDSITNSNPVTVGRGIKSDDYYIGNSRGQAPKQESLTSLFLKLPINDVQPRIGTAAHMTLTGTGSTPPLISVTPLSRLRSFHSTHSNSNSQQQIISSNIVMHETQFTPVPTMLPTPNSFLMPTALISASLSISALLPLTFKDDQQSPATSASTSMSILAPDAAPNQHNIMQASSSYNITPFSWSQAVI